MVYSKRYLQTTQASDRPEGVIGVANHRFRIGFIVCAVGFVFTSFMVAVGAIAASNMMTVELILLGAVMIVWGVLVLWFGHSTKKTT